jgi:SAM-dependent methyltransferase
MLATAKVRDILERVRELDRSWQKRVEVPEKFTPWMPSDVAQYLVLLIEAMAEASGDRFLEVGCGPGTKMLLARELFGLDVHGFDRVPEYVAAAWEQGLSAFVHDAAEYPDYDKYDIVFFNRPFRDRDAQRELESKIWRSMRRGAVVIAMNLETQPPDNRWLVVTDDWESRRGVWLKL